jgi:hypothetical protein
MIRRHRRPVLVTVGSILTLVALAGFLRLLLGPIAWSVAGGTVRALDGKERADAINTVRQIVLTTVGGAAVLLSLLFTARTYFLTRRGQVADRYTKAIEQLGSGSADVRIGGIYGLERIMDHSPADHGTVVEVLAAFVREHAAYDPYAQPDLSDAEEVPRADVQAALTVLGRRPIRSERRRLDLRGSDLRGANLEAARLNGANLGGVWLDGANLRGTAMEHTYLGGGARLQHANLYRARLGGADMHRTRLNGANLFEAGLERTNLEGARLNGANLVGARLEHANLKHAELKAAHLGGVDLAKTEGLTVGQLDAAELDGSTKLPPGLGEKLRHLKELRRLSEGAPPPNWEDAPPPS